ncbi:MAG TPA: lasso peptide biosynthesis B2 protein [Candidatus Omnitrophica bacterium]|nr:lasso peptide biosynthesis B2 protein [Candidatus Omnitrophota bacterium]
MFPSKLRKFLKKLFYYSDFRLFFRIFIISLKISYRTSISSGKSLILLANFRKDKKNKVDTKKIINYVHLFLHLRKKIGLKNTCLTYSILLCRVLRESGINARINFASKKEEDLLNKEFPFSGHCWVSVSEKNVSSDWEVIFKYP